MEKLLEQGTREVVSLVFRLVERTKKKILFLTESPVTATACC